MNKTICSSSSVDEISQSKIRLNLISKLQSAGSLEMLQSPSVSSILNPPNTTKSLVYLCKNTENPLKSSGLYSDALLNAFSEELMTMPTLDVLNYYKIRSSKDQLTNETLSKHKLKFNSNFEAGNLLKAYHYKENEYILLIRPDFNNCRYSHWFYFSVKPLSPGEVTFHIVNIYKRDVALFQGMQIVAKKNKTWERAGKNIKFRENNEFLDYTEGVKAFSLSFTYDFTDTEKVYLAYTYPYTYKDLSDMLNLFSSRYGSIFRAQELCKSLFGLSCPIITITHDIAQYFKTPERYSDKKVVMFVGRVHPCETPSSYIMKGLISYILSDCLDAEKLRRNFVFKIIPMINPDGVKFGNSRCSLLGVDMNRRWINPHKILHPELYSAKEVVCGIKKNHEISMFCDVHSHAKKKNVFMYGCNLSKGEKTAKKTNTLAKLIPILLARSNSHFSYKDTHFKMDKAKEATARIVMFREFGITNSYTIETSFFGSEEQKIFEINDWECVGSDLAKTCLSMISPFVIQSTLKPALEWLRKRKKSFRSPRPKSKRSKALDISPQQKSRNPSEGHSDRGIKTALIKKQKRIKSCKLKSPTKDKPSLIKSDDIEASILPNGKSLTQRFLIPSKDLESKIEGVVKRELWCTSRHSSTEHPRNDKKLPLIRQV